MQYGRSLSLLPTFAFVNKKLVLLMIYNHIIMAYFNYSIQEKVDMILALGRRDGNFLQAAALYAERYPNRRHPDRRTFSRVLNCLRTTGSFSRERPAEIEGAGFRGEDNGINVLAAIAANPQVLLCYVLR